MSAWNVANGLTTLRMLLIPVFVVVLFHDDGTRSPDGASSRRSSSRSRLSPTGSTARSPAGVDIVTEFGKLADPIADKALVGAALIGLSILGDLPWWITAVMLGREVGVTLLRFWVIRHGVIPASRGGKVKTMLQTVAIGLYLLPLSGWLHVVAEIVMLAAVALALITGPTTSAAPSSCVVPAA